MKHPVTTTLTLDELHKLKEAAGEESMLSFVHGAVMEKCEKYLNDRKPKESQRNNYGHPQGNTKPTERNEEIINDLDT